MFIPFLILLFIMIFSSPIVLNQKAGGGGKSKCYSCEKQDPFRRYPGKCYSCGD
jgi:hypothetical protein